MHRTVLFYHGLGYFQRNLGDLEAQFSLNSNGNWESNAIELPSKKKKKITAVENNLMRSPNPNRFYYDLYTQLNNSLGLILFF